MFTALAALLLASPGICPAAPVKDLSKVEIRKPVELNIRGGLPNFYQKLESGKPVRIAYFGGSITAQNGWRPQSLDYFRKLYPNSRIDQIHAAEPDPNSARSVWNRMCSGTNRTSYSWNSR